MFNYDVFFNNIQNIISKFYIFVIVLVLLFSSISIIFFTIILVFIYLLFLKINNQKLNDYCEETKNMIVSYGKNKITKIFICRNHMSNKWLTTIEYLTLNKLNKIYNVNKVNHTFLVFKLSNNKYLKLEKDNQIRMKILSSLPNCEIKEIAIKKKKALNKILETTQLEMGISNYFNYDVINNNCQIFVQEILKSLNKLTDKNKEFIYQDELYKVKYNNYFIGFVNSIVKLYTYLELKIK